ncbi:hypothetical protein HanIR_Chr09g0410801 [Helianthus annuus]|nr:hypothetical protein HanIR_Chr09g0410801 [Helianthus annuus]
MKLLRASHPSATMATRTCSGFSPPTSFRDGFGRNIPPVLKIEIYVLFMFISFSLVSNLDLNQVLALVLIGHILVYGDQ